MNSNRLRQCFFVFVALLGCRLFAQDCGTERWNVKTLSDADTSLIRFDSLIASTVTEQTQLTTQQIGQSDPRYASERTVFKINGLLTDYKRETDMDLHLVIHDAITDSTIVIEIPDPTCSSVVGTSRASLFAAARQWITDNIGNPTTSFKTVSSPHPVTISGVGFWDFLHGQRGMAANAREIHPVLTIQDWSGNDVAGNVLPDVFTVDVFPNPTKEDMLTVSVHSKQDIGKIAVSLINAVGRVVVPQKTFTADGNEYNGSVSTNNLAAGNYFVRVIAGGRLVRKAIVVSR